VPLVATLARGAVVAGGALVGRERELEAVRDRLAAARAGHGGVIAVGGEPGIGKTSVAQAGGGLARAGGGIVLWGRCFEGEWAPPYGPWVEILSDLVASLDPERLGGLAAGLGPGAAALAALVPLLGAALPPEAAPALLSAEEERFRLHEAGARLLLEVVAGGGGAAGPSLVVIDDLQWADRPTLALLLHLARLLEGARLVLLLT
jgi:predicted ATPase